MNIFFTFDDPLLCARALDDRRLVKMILETAQLLSTAARVQLPDTLTSLDKQTLYKSTHVNHPCSLWARASQANYEWLLAHGVALCTVFRLRFGKPHKSLAIIVYAGKFRDQMPKGEGLTVPPNCTPFKEEKNFRTAYRRHLSAKWLKEHHAAGPHPKWTNEMAPPFFMCEWPVDGTPGLAAVTKPTVSTENAISAVTKEDMLEAIQRLGDQPDPGPIVYVGMEELEKRHAELTNAKASAGDGQPRSDS